MQGHTAGSPATLDSRRKTGTAKVKLLAGDQATHAVWLRSAQSCLQLPMECLDEVGIANKRKNYMQSLNLLVNDLQTGQHSRLHGQIRQPQKASLWDTKPNYKRPSHHAVWLRLLSHACEANGMAQCGCHL